MKAITTDTTLTSHEAAALLQVNPSSIVKWIKDGRLHAYRTPGGHRRIRAADLVTFLIKHQMPVPRELEPAAEAGVVRPLRRKRA
jgi:excisionase family DNA binding protein